MKKIKLLCPNGHVLHTEEIIDEATIYWYRHCDVPSDFCCLPPLKFGTYVWRCAASSFTDGVATNTPPLDDGGYMLCPLRYVHDYWFDMCPLHYPLRDAVP